MIRLLPTLLLSFGILFSHTLKGQTNYSEGGCIPTRPLSNLAFGDGEHLKFTIHYSWGAINSDVGSATVDLKKEIFNGEDVFHCIVSGFTAQRAKLRESKRS